MALGLGIALPLIDSEKLLRWLPAYGVDPANIFQTAGVQMANLSIAKNSSPAQPDEGSATGTKPQDKAATAVTDSLQVKNLKIEKPYRILLVGDSFMAVAGGFGDILEQKMVGFGDTVILRKGKVSSGLSRPDYYDWNKEAASAINTFKPNVTIIMMGTNDAQSFETNINGKKTVAVFGSGQWDAEYAGRAASFARLFTDAGSIVYWIGLPAMRDATYGQKITRLTKLQESAVNANCRAKFVPAQTLLSDNNTYEPFMPDAQGIMRATRNPDGIHLSYFGGTIFAEKFIEKLKQDLNISSPNPTSPAQTSIP